MTNRTPLPFIDYSSRDWDSIRDSMFDYLRKKFPEEWTDFTESNLGIALVESVAYMFEVLSFSMDRAVNENFLSTATERESVAKLARLVGYKMASATAAAVTLNTIPGELDERNSPIFIAEGTKVNAGDLVFEVDRDYTLVKSGTDWAVNGEELTPIVLIGATEGSTTAEGFTSSGSKFQVFFTTGPSYIQGSVVVRVDGSIWTEVESLVIGDLINPDNQNIYEIEVDRLDRMSVKFGDDVTGRIPPAGSSLDVTYRTGGGVRGNIASSIIDEQVNCTEAGIPAKIHFVNGSKASGGTDRETVEHAKIFAPVWGRTTDRAITLQDYIALCNGFSDGATGRVAKAGVVAEPSDGLSNVVTVYAWTEDKDGYLIPAPLPLKNKLYDFLNDRKVITVYLSPIQDGTNVPIDFDLMVSVYPGFDRNDVVRRVNVVMKLLFESSRVRFDNQLRMSWVHDYVTSVPGVESVSIVNPDPDTQTLTIIDIESGTIPSQVGALPNQIIIPTPATRDENYYSTFLVIIDYGTENANPLQIFASTAATGVSTTVLTVGEIVTAVEGVTYKIQHPRKIRVSPTPEGDISNRRMLLPQTLGGLIDAERSVVSINADNIITVEKDFSLNPLTGSPVIVTADYLVSQTHSLTLGTVNTTVEAKF